MASRVTFYIEYIQLPTPNPTIPTRSSKADSRFAPSQWETALLYNDVSHRLGTSLESDLSSIH